MSKLRSRTTRLLLCAAMATFGVASSWGTALAHHVGPEIVAGNPKCRSLNESWSEIKADPPSDGVYVDADGVVEITVDLDEELQSFNWSSNTPIAAVFVKGGPVGGNLYSYDPPELKDEGLSVAPYDISHISFCYGTSSEPQEEDPDRPDDDGTGDPEQDPEPVPDRPDDESDPSDPPAPGDGGGEGGSGPQAYGPPADGGDGPDGTVKVKGQTIDRTLPRTGVSILKLMAVAMALVAAGLSLQASAQRRSL